MPVSRFNTLDSAKKALWNFNPDKDYYLKLSEFYELAFNLSPFRHPSGIFKYKSLKESQKHLLTWNLKNKRT